VRRYLLGRDLTGIESRLAAAHHERSELGRAESDLRHALAGLDADVTAAESAAERGRAACQPLDLAEAVSRAEGSKARATGLVALLEERRRSLERALTTTVDQDVIAALEAEAGSLVDRLTEADSEAARLLPAADELANAEARLSEEAAEVEVEWRHET